MSMRPKDAAKVLGIVGDITLEIVKTAYRKACSKYHPDRNPAGTEMMKMVNQAYDALREYDYEHPINTDDAAANYGDELNDALNAVINLRLNLELCGAWVWVTGDTKQHKETLKAAGYKWAKKKVAWYFRPADYKSYSRGKYSLDDIRGKFGSKPISGQGSRQIQAA